jgi:hypothetical protein
MTEKSLESDPRRAELCHADDRCTSRTRLGLMEIAFLTIFIFCAVAFRAAAQNAMSATAVGTVTDPAGAVVPNATVIFTNNATGVSTNGTTNADGSYYVPYLAPGTYTLTIEAKDFQKYVQTGVLLELGQVPRFDVKLSLGSQTQVVQVSAESLPLLETQAVDVGGIDQAKFIQNQPMMQAKPYYLMYYTMGSEYGGNNTFILAGLSGLYLAYSIDGMGAKQTPRSAVGTVNNSGMPPVDAITEAHVWATGIPAELGHDAGGAENMAIKSGTNQVHWTAEERYINHDFIHHELFQDGPLTTPFEYHNFDSTLGFPIYIPKIYDGRDKSFLFLGERFDYDHETNNSVTSVTTPAMEGEDTTQAPGAYFNWTNAQPIYDPATIACVGGSGPACTGGTWTAKQFPGNVIPLSRIDPVAKAFLALNPYATPNQVPLYVPTGPQNNLSANTFYLADKEGYLARFDQVMGKNDKLFFHWIYNMYHTHPGRQNVIYNVSEDYLLDPTSASFARPEPFNTVNYVIDETHVFSSSLINEFRAGYQSRSDVVRPFTENQNWAGKLGIPGVPGDTFPAFVTSGNSSVTWNADPGAFFKIIQDDFDFADNITKISGHHAFKWGWEGLRMRENDTGTESNSAPTSTSNILGDVPLPSGLYVFSGATTGFPFKPNTGNSFASFLLGAPDYATFTEQLEPYEPRWWSNEFYFQDAWQATAKLTLDLGVRYDFETAGNTKAGYKSEFNPTAIDPVTGLTGAITNPTGLIYSNAGNNWAPRVGVDYNFLAKWVFRGAFDVFTADDMAEMGMDNYEAVYAVAPPPGSPLPGMYLSQGPGPLNYPINSNHTANYVSATNNFAQRTATYFDPHLHNGHTMSWTAGVQYQFKPNTMIELDYIGSSGYGLINQYAVNVNDLPQSIYTSTNTTLLNQVQANNQPYLPFPQFGQINYYSNWDGSIFNSGIVDFQKRFDRGISWDFHYTYEKLLDEGPGNQQLSSTGVSSYTVGTGPELNVSTGSGPLSISYNKAATKVIDPGSFKNQFTGTVTWEIPVGQGRRFMNHGGFANAFLGDWRLLTIQNWRSGNAVDFLQAGNPNKELPGEVFMNHVPGQSIRTPNFSLNRHNMWPEQFQNPYYNINAFAYPTAYSQGNVGTDAAVDGPVWWPQYSLAKTVAYRERYRLTVRMDADMLFPEFSTMDSANSAANITSPSLFGKTAPQGYGFSTYGSLNGTYVGSLRLEF